MKVKIISISIAAFVIIYSPFAFAQQSCSYSYWVWQGGERVKVCCNQQGLCLTKFGVYSYEQ